MLDAMETSPTQGTLTCKNTTHGRQAHRCCDGIVSVTCMHAMDTGSPGCTNAHLGVKTSASAQHAEAERRDEESTCGEE